MAEKKNIKRENFVRISESRVSKIIILFEQLTNLNNSSFYEYSDEDVEKIFSTLENEMKKSKEILLKSYKKKKTRFEL